MVNAVRRRAEHPPVLDRARSDGDAEANMMAHMQMALHMSEMENRIT